MNLENNLQKNVTNQANQLNKLQSNLIELNAQLSKKNLDLETQAKAHTDQLRQLKKNLAKTHAEEIKKINEELQLKKQEVAKLKAFLLSVKARKLKQRDALIGFANSLDALNLQNEHKK